MSAAAHTALLTILLVCDVTADAVAASKTAPVCFDKLHLDSRISDSLQQMSQMFGVFPIEFCAHLCTREAKCVAFRDLSTAQRCQLLKGRRRQYFEFVSSSAPLSLAEVWRQSGRSFRECPSDFTLRWGASRYTLSTDKRIWNDAEKRCREQGGNKLAELTNGAEIEAVVQSMSHLEIEWIFVGGWQRADAKEPAGCWIWYWSEISIPSD